MNSDDGSIPCVAACMQVHECITKRMCKLKRDVIHALQYVCKYMTASYYNVKADN